MKIFITILVLMLLVATFWSVVMYAIEVWQAHKRAKSMRELNNILEDIKSNKK